MTAFENALFTFCQEDDSNLFSLTNLRQTCFDRIMAGGGVISTLLSGSLNGKSHQSQIEMDASELFTSLTTVLSAAGGAENLPGRKSTIFDFSEISR